MMTASIDRHGDGRVAVRLRGDLDMASADLALQTLTEAVSEPPVTLVLVDLGALTFLDSCGLRSLIQGHKLVTAQGAQFQLGRPQPIVARVLDIVGLNEMLGVTDQISPDLIGDETEPDQVDSL